jgi:hypothetical protein
MFHCFAVLVDDRLDKGGAGVFRNICHRIVRNVNHLVREVWCHLRKSLVIVSIAHLRLVCPGRVISDDNAIGTTQHVDVARHP